MLRIHGKNDRKYLKEFNLQICYLQISYNYYRKQKSRCLIIYILYVLQILLSIKKIILCIKSGFAEVFKKFS